MKATFKNVFVALVTLFLVFAALSAPPPAAAGTAVWTKYDNTIPAASSTSSTNGRLPLGLAGSADDVHAYTPTVINDNGTYKLWYVGYDGASFRIYYATSPDGLTWTKYDNTLPSASDTTSTNGRIPAGTAGKGDDVYPILPAVIKDGSTYKMWYTGYDGANYRIYYATSPDGLTWTKYDNTVLAASDTTGTNGRIPLGTAGKGDDAQTGYQTVILDGLTYKMWYTGYDGANYRIYYATSSDGLTWTKYNNATPAASDTTSTDGRVPLGTAGKGDDAYTFAPNVIKDGDTYRMWYTGYDGANYRIYYATSPNGLTWTKYDNTTPAASDTTSTNGRVPLGTTGKGDDSYIGYPTAIKDGVTYKMWYAGHDGSTWRIYYATLPLPAAPTIGTPSSPTSFSATGGTITTAGGDNVHTFTSNGTFTPSSSGNVQYLVIGGGGGSSSYGGGGGAGGYLTGTDFAVTAQAYSITVGAGGAPGSSGSNSVFSSITATGGGRGGGSAGGAQTGGSGGGSEALSNPPAWYGAAGTAGQGNAGGNGTATSSPYGGGGGGGAGGAGSNGSSVGGAGGAGLSSSITGSVVTRAGGGGGATYYSGTGGAGGSGGGGAGSGSGAGTAGTTNTGGGGGGGRGDTSSAGGAGGSGIVIIRYTPTTADPTTSIRWNFTDNASNEDGFKVYDGSGNLVVTCASVNLTYCDETGLSPNTQYTRKVVAYSAAGNSSYSSTATIYTLANAPSTPTVSSTATSTANVIVAVNSNPAATEFAIQETGSTNYVNKTTGALQGSASWGTYADFGSGSGITVTGLSVNTQYTFQVKARNADNAETAFGSTATAYTRAATPPAPTVGARASTTSQPVTPLAGTNPSGTTLAIYKEVGTTCDGSGGSYLAANGSDNGSTAVYQTAATWSTVTASGLSQDQKYAFCVIAKNGENIATSFGDAGTYNSGVPGLSGDHTITQDTSLISFTDGNDAARLVNGVDSGTDSTNTAKLRVESGVLTVNANETIAAGVFEITGTGSIAIATGGVLKVGTPIWVVDTDVDGFPAVANKLYVQANAPTGGRRRNAMTRISITDCDDTIYQPYGCLRKPVTLTYSGTTLTNHDVVFSADTASLIAAGKMQSDCGDIRVRDSDGATVLSHWIEGGCNTATTQIWARIPSIPDGGKTIYMDYEGSTIADGFQSWAGTFTLMNNAACPAGWTQNSIFDNAFPYGSATYGTTGGASSHSHAQVSCNSGAASTSSYWDNGAGPNVSAANHTHTGLKVDIASASNVLPPYLDTVMCKSANLNIPASFIAMFDASVPSGWTRFSTLDNTFPRGAATYGSTGGSTTHSHPTTGGYTTSISTGGQTRSSGSLVRANSGHYHTSVSGTTNTGNNTPPYLDMIFGQADSQTAASPGLISIVDVLPPFGWTRFTALDSKFPRGAASYGGTGGTTTHTHSVTITTGGGSHIQTVDSAGNQTNAQNHTHSCTTTSDAQSNIPPYTTAIFAKKNTPSATTTVGAETYR